MPTPLTIEQLDAQTMFADLLWVDATEFTEAVPEHTWHWLVDIESLTERLQAHTSAFSVKVQSEGIAPLFSHEQTQLNATQVLVCASASPATISTAQIRQVLLLDDDTPWVSARSILPQALCDNEFAALGNQPLGKILFNDPRFKRQPFQCTKLPVEHPFCRAFKAQHPLFGRRSVFVFLEHLIMVTEMFLPDSPAYNQKDLPQ